MTLDSFIESLAMYFLSGCLLNRLIIFINTVNLMLGNLTMHIFKKIAYPPYCMMYTV